MEVYCTVGGLFHGQLRLMQIVRYPVYLIRTLIACLKIFLTRRFVYLFSCNVSRALLQYFKVG